jgi:hypothetical protein
VTSAWGYGWSRPAVTSRRRPTTDAARGRRVPLPFGGDPGKVVWSSLWPSRPDDLIVLELAAEGVETSLQFTLLTPHEPPDQSKTGHIRRRMNHLLFADLRFSYGQ